ncbi:MAG: hypothetical protein JOZ18_14785, partial [Chloroflexi bacterium]|nr:hypothetical protein [Chloroflexota bacterium]
LEEVDIETDHLGVLVNALIEMSRIEMGALVLDKEWCDIVEVIHGALLRLERVLSGRPVRTEFQPQLPLIYADHVQLERVFYNLIEHIVRHSPAESELLIAVDSVNEDTRDHLRAKVIDRSWRVSVDERERIFKTFSGLRGSGLGLAISRGIIEAHQGRIGVEAAVDGDGSCYVFTLPLHTYNGASFQAPSVPEDME